MRYANQGFDEIQHLACELTEQDRKAGLPASKYGYSKARFADAERILKAQWKAEWEAEQAKYQRTR